MLYEVITVVVALLTADLDLIFSVAGLSGGFHEVLRQQLTLLIEIVTSTLRKQEMRKSNRLR